MKTVQTDKAASAHAPEARDAQRHSTRSGGRQGEESATTHMRIIVERYGGPEVLQAVEEKRPEPKRGEARVRVLAAGVGLPDLMMREGIHPETPSLPFTPGWDLVGV